MSIRKGSVIVAGYINDQTLVHKEQTETIPGQKTFSGNNVFSGNNTFTGNTEFTGGMSLNTTLLAKRNTLLDGGELIFEKANNDPLTDNASMELYNGTIKFVSTYNGSTVTPCTIDFVNNTIIGTATTALWADLAENYETDEKYPIGTLIRFGGEKDITIAQYGLNCNGVISDKPGYLLDADLENSQPIALVGKTPVRIIGRVKKFDRLVLSPIAGVAKVQTTSDEKVIAIALANSDDENEKLVMCVTKFNLD